MPSPLAHLAAGYTLYKVSAGPYLDGENDDLRSRALRLLFVAGTTMLPDFDSVLGLLSGDFARFHNNVTHSLFVGFAAAVLVGMLMAWQQQGTFARWFVLALMLYELHVVLDSFTPGRGVMALWPFSSARYRSPLPLFYGFHWSDGLFSINHLWTFLTESAFAAALYVLLKWRSKSNDDRTRAGSRRRRKAFF